MFSFLLSNYISLLSLINPLGGIPVFLSLTAQHPANWVKKQIFKTSANVFVICIVSFLIGNYVLEFFGISINALKIAGGIIIARSGFQLLNATHKKDIAGKSRRNPCTRRTSPLRRSRCLCSLARAPSPF